MSCSFSSFLILGAEPNLNNLSEFRGPPQSVPESAGALHFAWQTVFSDYAAWVDAQYAAYAAIAQGSPPLAERVQTLFRQQEESTRKALKEEKKLLKRLRARDLTSSDIQSLVDKAFADTEAENWQPTPSEVK